MRKVARASALLLGLAPLAGAAPAHAGDDAFFRSCEVKRRVALVGADAAALGLLLADGAQYAHSNGQVDDKASLVRRIASREIRYRTLAVKQESYACNPTGCEVDGTQTLGVSAGGHDATVHNRFHATWLRAGDACKLVAYRSEPLAAPTK